MRSPAKVGLRLAASIAYIILTFVLSSIPGNKLLLPTQHHLDLLYHAIEYGLLAAVLLWYFSASGPASSKGFIPTLFAAVLICAIAGGLNELWQRHVPGRFASLDDEIANIIGASAGALVWAKRHKRNIIHNNSEA